MFSLEECIGAVSDGLGEYRQALLFFYCQHLQMIQILANTNLEIVELAAHRKPESVVLTVGRVV